MNVAGNLIPDSPFSRLSPEFPGINEHACQQSRNSHSAEHVAGVIFASLIQLHVKTPCSQHTRPPL